MEVSNYDGLESKTMNCTRCFINTRNHIVLIPDEYNAQPKDPNTTCVYVDHDDHTEPRIGDVVKQRDPMTYILQGK